MTARREYDIILLSISEKQVIVMTSEPIYAEELAWTEPRREELICGKVVMMAPPATNHGVIAGNVHALFHSYLRGKSCTVFPDDVPLFLSDMDYYRPDLMVVCDREKIKADGVHGAPDLVVEILSPSTGRQKTDLSGKRCPRVLDHQPGGPVDRGVPSEGRRI